MSDGTQQEQSSGVSLGARMWVQTARTLKTLFDLIPEESRAEVMSLITDLHASDALRSVRAEHRLYQIIDGEPTAEPTAESGQPEQAPPGNWRDITDWVRKVREGDSQKFSKVWELRVASFYVRVFLARNSTNTWLETGQDYFFQQVKLDRDKSVDKVKWRGLRQLRLTLQQASSELDKLLDLEEDI